MYKQLKKPAKLPAKAYRYISKRIPQNEPNLPNNRAIIPVCEPDLRGRELKYVTEAIRNRWVSSMGPAVQQFESSFAEFIGTKYAVSVTNGTHALHLALSALDVGPGDEVIVPSFTMIAVANAVRYVGATPIFVDVRPDTWNIDENKIEPAITKKTKALLIVHTYGHPAEMDTIRKIANKYKLSIISDACEAHGAVYKGKKIGMLSDACCFSFYANKVITTGEGGMVVTNDTQLYQLMFKLHNHAFSSSIHFWHEYCGYNYRMTNLQAAMGLAQLERIDTMLQNKRSNAMLYLKLLSDIPYLQFPVELEGCTNIYWMFGILLQEKSPISRDYLREFLASRGIETRSFFIPLHFQPVYCKEEYLGAFPVSEYLGERGLYLPSASTLTKANIRFICNTIHDAFTTA